MSDEWLRQFCDTDAQRRLLDALRDYGSRAEAARALGIAERNVYNGLKRLKRRAAKQGYSPEHDMRKTVPEGYKVAGVSTLYDQDGEVKAQWVKSKSTPEENFDEIREAFLDALPREKALQKNKSKVDDNLLNLYLITDYHLGMRAWWEEAGENWDTKIAENLIVRWFQKALTDSPRSHTAVLGQLGDFLHWDGVEAVTPSHGYVLDADTRYQKLIRVAIRVLRRIIRMLLKRHERVHLVMAEGNHDPASSMWLREVFSEVYADEPRISVDTSPDPYYCFEFGNVSLFFHHGHKRKVNNVDSVFVSKFREVFGRTKFSYGHMGHLHHDRVLETYLMHVEQHQTLAAADSYASRGGWASGRSAKCITYHSEYGEVERKTLTPAMV